MRMNSVMSHDFSRAPQANIPRSKFDRSFGHKTTFNAGYLVPIIIDEALPGDTFNLNMTAFARLATPLFPFMDNLYLDSFFFSIPYRLVWDNWERFNGAQDDPGDSTDFLIPQMVSPVGGYLNQTLSDYFGLPIQLAGLTHSSLWHRAYNLVWNEFFRDENLQNSVVVDKDDGPDASTDYVLLRRGKRYDYFTSCLPWPQKGTAVTLPLGTTAPVIGIGAVSAFAGFGAGNPSHETGGGAVTYPFTANTNVAGTFCIRTDGVGPNANPLVYADLSAATAATVNQLREAFQIQRMYERDARGGTRYIESILSHFGVRSSDQRLQRPEYLGGGSSPIMISPVAKTSSTDATSPQANLAAFGTATAINHGFVKSFEEHCLIIGMVSVRADLNYQQGMNRMFSRSTRFDFYWPALAHLGEQEVLNKEIFAQATAADDQVFGYQERFAEYRYKPSQISGQFRSDFATPLDAWHLAQDFTALPVLNSSFIEENPPVDRVKALAATYPDFIMDTYTKLICARPMPMYSVPGLIDHF